MTQGIAPADDRHDRAAEWLVATLADPAVEGRADFQDWLSDPANARAFATARAGWQIAGDLGPELLAEFSTPPAPRQRRRWQWPRLLPAGLALAAFALGGIWLDRVRPDLRLSFSADHVSRAGQLQDFALIDGSRTLLDGGSALDFADLYGSRQVTLLQGAAWFDVVKNADRPFVVRFGQTEIRALGTRFSVRDCGNCIEVTLEEGSVEITRPGAPSLRLEPGQQLRQIADLPAEIRLVDLPEAMGWRDGRFVFYNATLAEVSGVLERHGAGAIVIRNADLASRQISGSIDLGAAPTELRALAEAMGFRILPLPGGQLLLN